MKKISRVISIAWMLTLSSMASAQHFEVGGITYNVLSSSTVEVAPKECAFYRGRVNIPSTVVYDGVTYNVVALGEKAFYGGTLSSVTIPSSVTRIKTQCFLFANGPTSVSIPASVTDIEEQAFAAFNMTAINVDDDNPTYRSISGMLFTKDTATLVECPMAVSGIVNLPQNTRHLAPSAFAYCQNITGVSLPEGLSSIGRYAFGFNESLNNLTIPASVSYIGTNPFADCSSLDNLTMENGNNHYFMDGFMIYSIAGDTLKSCHKSADSLFLPNSLRVVSGFSGNSDVKYVHIPDSVRVITANAFSNSTLASIDLPGQMELIDEWAFYSCLSLNRVSMPSNLETLGQGCFYQCSTLTSIVIPNGLRTIPREAFLFCYSLSQITWGDAVEIIDTLAFGGCPLTELRLPATLRTVRLAAFNSYTNGARMNQIVFSAPVDTIEAEAFTWRYIGTLRMKNTIPPVSVTTLDYGADYGCLIEATVDSIIIPCGSLNTWLSDLYWRQFADRYHEDCDGIEDAEESGLTLALQGRDLRIDGTAGQPVRVLDAVGRTLFSGSAPATVRRPASGLYLVHSPGKKAVKVAAIH